MPATPASLAQHRLADRLVRPHEIALCRDPGRDGVEVEVEHPTGFFTVTIDVTQAGGTVAVTRSALLRTARLLMRGEVFVPSSVWNQGASH